ncbi:i- spanin subunit Rz [Pectobacterium phage vB_PcaP_P15_PC2B6]|uniref:I- spanin subunit Rz n=1 Tax=Pectobacterium phage vB_PcaP_P15_PC2B6 TaxID=2968434 RepID=A0AAX3BPI4_9CAUD|nr:i- spanin subunit Rz [Pectobacterium phage vB_PcaP_P15_PC2B6]
MVELFKRLLPIIIMVGLFASGWQLGSNHKDNQWKEEVRIEYIKKVDATKQTQTEVSAISKKYQEDLEGLEGSTDRVIADLRADNKRLRVNVKATGSPDGNGRCLFDGKAELDEGTAKRLIGITQRGDAHIEALQATIRSLQGSKVGVGE